MLSLDYHRQYFDITKLGTKLYFIHYLRWGHYFAHYEFTLSLHFIPILLLKLGFNLSVFWFFGFLLILFSLLSNNLLKYISKNRVKNMLPESGLELRRKISICKEKSETATKPKLVTKIKKHNQLYFGTLVLALYWYWYWQHKIRTFLKLLAWKKAATWQLKKSQER